MYRIWLLIISLLFTNNYGHTQFIEKFRSEPGRKPATNLIGVLEGGKVIRDINNNGSDDIPMIIDRDEESDMLVVRDGSTKEVLWKLDLAVLNNRRPASLAFFDFTGNGSGEALVGMDDTEHILFDPDAADEILYRATGAKLYAIADADEDNLPDLILWDENQAIIIVVGWQSGGAQFAGSNSDHKLQFLHQNITEYSLTLKYETKPGFSLATGREMKVKISDFDVNGDGIMEIVMLRDDDTGNPAGLVVVNGATREKRWEFKFPDEHRNDILNGFHGFFEINGDGQKEAIFGNRTIVTQDKVVHTLNENFEIVLAYDIDGDGYDDLLGHNVRDSTIQVWGLKTDATDISQANIEKALSFVLHQNYPNPFNPSTTIRFSLPESQHVKLRILDLIGREVTTLVDSEMSGGVHRVTFDAGNLSSGLYLVRLEAGSFTSVKRMMLVK
ncbi:T9SS type A sorting domain-containing protein [candidate division KSB1 bacterium]|nr:T9SS type A sorting domain-containing protein [candidate division KSB1 bacterium]